ncbi:MAG: aspartate aminotransferase family protein [Geminicoccaceae bacterium]|nr:aspartate aminotransferase family protein [Geminicoccaceae bacterium]
MSMDTSGDLGRLRESIGKHMIRYVGAFAPYLGAKARGSYIYDDSGRAILDFCSGQMCATLGHNHPAVTEAIEQSCRDVIHLFSGLLSPPVVRLAEELGAILPPGLQKMMFMSTGSESNEAAVRMAKLKAGGFEVVALTGSWHGITAGAASSTYNGGRSGYGPPSVGTMAMPGPNSYRCPIKHCRDKCDMTCLDVGFGLYDSQSVGSPAAVIVEPIQSSAGIIVPPEGYFVKLKALCDERGLLVIFDEAQTGLGRLGSNFAFEQLGVVPDILTLSKTLGNGVPMAATVTSDQIEEECFDKKFLFYTSHLSDPLPAAVGLAVLRVLREENLAARAAEMGRYFMDGLRALQQRYECIGDVRGRGLLIGLEIVKDRESRQPDRPLAHKVQRLCLEMGLVLHAVRADSQSSVRLAPPLTVSKAELDESIDIMDRAFRRALDS